MNTIRTTDYSEEMSMTNRMTKYNQNMAISHWVDKHTQPVDDHEHAEKDQAQLPSDHYH